MAQALSNNHFSHDQQLADALGWLQREDPAMFETFLHEFPEWERASFNEFSSALDVDEMGVDIEWPQWATDWIEAQTSIYWEEGEPWVRGDDE